MDWDRVWLLLRRCFDDTLALVHQRHPEITISSSRFSTPYFPFIANAGFILEPNQEHETLVLQFTCGASDRSFWRPDGTSHFPDPDLNRHAVHCFIQTGEGEELTQLEPRLLPEDVKSVDYEEAVLNYVAASIDFIGTHADLILRQAERPPLPENG